MKALFRTALVVTGCLIVLGVLSASDASAQAAGKTGPAEGPAGPAGVELQTLLMRFADQAVFATVTAIDQVRPQLDTPEKRFVALERQQVMGSAVYLIATEADPDTALFDMIVLVTLERIGTEQYWMPTYFGDAGGPYLEALRQLEASIWSLGKQVMTEPQSQELQAIVAGWEERPPDFFRSASFFRLSRVSARQVRAAGAGEKRTRGLFASVREAAETADELQLQIERLIFYLQRLPLIVGAQAEVQLSRVGQVPEVASSLEDLAAALNAAGRLADLADQMGTTLERVNELLPQEQGELTDVLASGEERLRGLLTEAQATAEALRDTVDAANSLAANIQLPAEVLKALESGEITAALAELATSTGHLETTIASAERLMAPEALEEIAPQLDTALDEVSGAGENLIGAAYVAGVKLIVIFLIGLLLTLLVYRYLVKRQVARLPD